MFYNATGDTVQLGSTDMDYVVFGKGVKPLVILPGLSDGLNTVKNKEIVLAMYYKIFAKDFRVYIFSRKNLLSTDCTIKDMAQDQANAMKKLGITSASIMGVSQGGMIAQCLAIDYPDMVDTLILGVTTARANENVEQVVSSWVDMAKAKDYRSLIIDTMEKTYSQKQINKYRITYPVITRMGKPKDYTRFIIQANACLNHNTYDSLKDIKCPTLVIGGGSDMVVGANSSSELSENIENSKLIVYPELGHGAYEETKDFNMQILDFLLD